MRFVMLGVLVGCFCLDPIRGVKAASWTSAKFPGEQNRAVQGCGDNPQNVGDWLCIVVRGAIGRIASAVNSRCSRASWSYRCNEVRPHDLDSGFSSPVTLQSNFIGELTNGYRKNRGSMCVAIPRRRTLLAAYSEEHRRPLIAQFPVHGGIVTETRIQSAYNVGSLTQSRPDVSELRRSASAYSSACITRARGRAKWCAADPGPPKLKQRRSELCKIPGLQRIQNVRRRNRS